MSELWVNWWLGFSSGLAATVLGIPIGLPFALYLDRCIKAIEGRQREAEERERLETALFLLSHAMQDNLTALRYVRDSVHLPPAGFVPYVDTERWAMFRAVIRDHLGNTYLKGELTSHFAKLDRLMENYRHLVRHVPRPEPGEGEGSPWRFIAQESDLLAGENQRLLGTVQREVGKLRAKARSERETS